jgi:hypothetical protein
MQAVRQRRTREDNSRGMRAPKRAIQLPDGARAGLALAGVLGVAALVGATFSTVIRITVGTTTRLANLDTSLTGWERHGPALLVVAGLALVMLVGALRGSSPACVAVLVCGVAALVVVLAFDVPHLDDTGQVGQLYADAAAGPRVGFWLELCGGLLLAASGLGLWLLARRSDASAGAARSRTAHREEGIPDAGAPVRDA